MNNNFSFNSAFQNSFSSGANMQPPSYTSFPMNSSLYPDPTQRYHDPKIYPMSSSFDVKGGSTKSLNAFNDFRSLNDHKTKSPLQGDFGTRSFTMKESFSSKDLGKNISPFTSDISSPFNSLNFTKTNSSIGSHSNVQSIPRLERIPRAYPDTNNLDRGDAHFNLPLKSISLESRTYSAMETFRAEFSQKPLALEQRVPYLGQSLFPGESLVSCSTKMLPSNINNGFSNRDFSFQSSTLQQRSPFERTVQFEGRITSDISQFGISRMDTAGSRYQSEFQRSRWTNVSQSKALSDSLRQQWVVLINEIKSTAYVYPDTHFVSKKYDFMSVDREVTFATRIANAKDPIYRNAVVTDLMLCRREGQKTDKFTAIQQIKFRAFSELACGKPTWQSALETMGRGMIDADLFDPEKSLPKQMLSFRFTSSGYKDSSVRIGCINGMNVKLWEAEKYAEHLSSFAGGRRIDWVYNNSHGAVADVLEILSLNLFGYSPNTSKLLIENWTKFHQETLDSPNIVYLQIAHSQGGIHLLNALEEAPQEIRRRISVLTFGSPVEIPETLCYRVKQFACEGDLIPNLIPTSKNFIMTLGGVEEADRYLPPRSTVFIKPHPDTTSAHEFLNPAFDKYKEKFIEDLISLNVKEQKNETKNEMD